MTYLPDGLPAPVPARDGVDAPLWEGLSSDELRVQRCGSCGAFQHPAEWFCVSCGAPDPAWRAVAPRGRIYTWTRVWHAAHPALRGHCPYIAVVVELDDAPGALVLGNLLGDPEIDPVIGSSVEGVFEPPLLQWCVAG